MTRKWYVLTTFVLASGVASASVVVKVIRPTIDIVWLLTIFIAAVILFGGMLQAKYARDRH
jgi:hypothetical protein